MNIYNSITTSYMNLIRLTAMLLIITLMITLVGFYYFKEDWYYDVGTGENLCDNLMHCFMSQFYYVIFPNHHVIFKGNKRWWWIIRRFLGWLILY